MTGWEYLDDTNSDPAHRAALGADGWQAYAVMPLFGRADDSMVRHFYKRPLHAHDAHAKGEHHGS